MIAALALATAACYRYVQQPTFWLDEAFVAVSLRHPSPQVIFASLEYGQLFPRIYLSAIAAIREVFGYRVWSLRLLPFVCFLAATFLWTLLLLRRSRSIVVLGFISGGLLIGATFWLDQAIQLKQYTFDVALALLPFLISDQFFDETLVRRKRLAKLAMFVLPCLLSYTYPLAMGARIGGWYVQRGRIDGWRISPSAAALFSALVIVAMVGIWFTDHRFNLLSGSAYLAYWHDCILGATVLENPGAALRLVAKFLWGWHGRQPAVTAVLVPLQAAGVYAIVSCLKRRSTDTGADKWGSRSVGALLLLAGVILASALANYPICSGRVVIFAQVHTQLLAIEGGLFFLALTRRRRAVLVYLWLAVAVIGFHSVRAFGRLVSAEPGENLTPVVSLIDPGRADVVLVHSCSVAQVRSLPEPLPVSRIEFANQRPQLKPGEKTWVLWTHLGNEACTRELDEIRRKARTWQMVHEGPGTGLALVEF